MQREIEKRRALPTGVRRHILLAGAAVLGAFALVRAEQVHRNGFETRETAWVRGAADAAFRETVHDVTDATAHSGQYSEHIRLQAEPGTFIYYTYSTARAPVGDELALSLWVKANRPGAQLMARLVLPRERAAGHPEDRLTTLLRGDQYQTVGRWQRLELRRPVKMVREQQQLLRAELHRDIDLADAYIDRLVLNVYGGPGETELWLDDLEIGPVVDSRPFQTTSRPAEHGPTAVTRPGGAPAVELRQTELRAAGRHFFIRGIRHSGTPLGVLRDAGFNTVWFNYAAPPATVEEAVNLGFWVVPSLPVTGEESRLQTPDAIRSEVMRFPVGDAVLFWDLGGGLVDENSAAVARAAEVVRAADPQRPIGADVWDGFGPYGRTLDLVGVHRWPLLTGLELTGYRDWLDQRRRLTRPGTFLWTWVQTHLPEWYTTLVYGQAGSAGFEEPIGPQPEQIRLLAYIAVGTGCKGLGFWSDQFLGDSHQGRDRLLALALLNLELQMIEPMLVTADPPVWIDTSDSDVKAAVMRTAHGTLVLPVWLGKGSQFVPGQAAKARLSMTVPQVPNGTQAWEVSPAEVRSLPSERVIGGTRVTLPEFGLTGVIVFTSDNSPTGILVRFQEQLRRMRRPAAQWAHDLAEVELEKVAKVEAQLEAAGHTLPDGARLLSNARTRLSSTVEAYNSGDFTRCYQEAERALRPLRILMRAQWEQAIKALDTPVASPYAVSFFTLPRHWAYLDRLRQGTLGPNVLPDGNFESGTRPVPDGWTLHQSKLDPVDLKVRRLTDSPKEGRQYLALDVTPQNQQMIPKALERTYLAVQSPPVRLAPGTPVRISAWVRLPWAIGASPDGALLFDSAGREPLAVRVTDATGWKRFIVYRVVPASGTISVTLALTGLGRACFDDVRIEPISAGPIRTAAR